MSYDVCIIGGGIIGASIAYTLSQFQLKILVLEQENDIAMGATRANSAIIHAGYDPKPGTLMAKLAVEGAGIMPNLCKQLGVLYSQIGSLVVGFSPAELNQLAVLYNQGITNGVKGLRLLTKTQTLALEPLLAPEVAGALYAPEAGIIDPWGLCLAELELAVVNGAVLHCSSEVVEIAAANDKYLVKTAKGANYETRFLVNAAGLGSQKIAALLAEAFFETQPTRGEYFVLDKSSGNLVNHIIFQCPTPESKGVLVVPTVHGNLLVGPNVQLVANHLQTQTTSSGLDFVWQRAKKSVPKLNQQEAIRNFAGIRARSNRGDFIIQPSAIHKGVLHLGGICSPGLSAAPAIANYAAKLLKEMGLKLISNPNAKTQRKQICFDTLSPLEKVAIIKKNPSYGRVICRCEKVTEGEIIQAIHSPVPPCSVDGIKRRVNSGMGRCQGGFCGPRVLELLARELGKAPTAILQDGAGSPILTSTTKGGTYDL